MGWLEEYSTLGSPVACSTRPASPSPTPLVLRVPEIGVRQGGWSLWPTATLCRGNRPRPWPRSSHQWPQPRPPTITNTLAHVSAGDRHAVPEVGRDGDLDTDSRERPEKRRLRPTDLPPCPCRSPSRGRTRRRTRPLPRESVACAAKTPQRVMRRGRWTHVPARGGLPTVHARPGVEEGSCRSF